MTCTAQIGKCMRGTGVCRVQQRGGSTSAARRPRAARGTTGARSEHPQPRQPAAARASLSSSFVVGQQVLMKIGGYQGSSICGQDRV
jgi:hypothetical protein